MLESLQITSAGGDSQKINEVLQVDPSIDLDEALEDRTDKQAKKEIEVQNTVKKVKVFENGQVGEINRMASAQFGNLREFSKNPITFIASVFTKKFAKGAGVVALALIIFGAVKAVIAELLRAGRWLDRRFKRDIRKEILQNETRKNQQKLKQGFSNVIITTTSGLRGGYKQTYNTLDRVRTNTFPVNIGANPMLLQSSGVSFSKNKGNGGRRFG